MSETPLSPPAAPVPAPDAPAPVPDPASHETRLQAIEDKIAGFERLAKNFAESKAGRTLAGLLGVDLGALL